METKSEVGLEVIGPENNVALITIHRSAKRNALSDALIEELHACFANLPGNIRAAVMTGEGEHFSAGLDLGELRERDATEGIFHSRRWHAAFEEIQFGKVPVIAALKGAVVGGGLELASAAHLRVADKTTFYALPEGSRGIFVGGGGSVRIPRLIGVSRMTDMMLTGRVLDAAEGHTAGISQYLVEKGESLKKAIEIGVRVAQNAPLTNYSVTHALPRIADQTMTEGFLTEAFISAIAQSAPEAKARLRDFLDNKANKVQRPKDL